MMRVCSVADVRSNRNGYVQDVADVQMMCTYGVCDWFVVLVFTKCF